MLSDRKAWAALAMCMAIGGGCTEKQEEPEGKVSFKADVQPILERNCVVCHHPGAEGYETSGLSLESYGNLMKGKNGEPVIVPGSANSSVLVRAVDQNANPPIVMPHRNPLLPKKDIQLIKEWVNQGALDN